MKILFDTNIVLDLLLDRKPFSDSAATLFSMVENGEITGLLCATTITTIHYLIAKVTSADQAKNALQKLMALFEIAPVNQMIIKQALQRKTSDFEDAVLLESARFSGVDIVVTRDPRGFQDANIKIFSPPELINALNAIKN